MAEKEIRKKYKKIHDNLTRKYYQKHSISKEDFTQQHDQNWKDCDIELKAKGFLIEETIDGNEVKIRAEIRKMAIEQLKEKGELPADFGVVK